MSKFVLAAMLLATSGSALAQNTTAQNATAAAPADPIQTAVQTTAVAFGQCVVGGLQAVPATTTPEAGAAQVMGGCNSQKLQLVQAAEAMIAALPDDRRAGATAQLQTRLAGAEAEIAAEITRRRAVATAPTPTPAGR